MIRPTPVSVFLCIGLAITSFCAPAAADAVLGFDTQVVSMDLRGTVAMPFGPGGSYVDTQVSLAPAQDYNGTRSNRSASVAAPPNDPIDPSDLDGRTFDLLSTIDLQFIMSFVDVDPTNDFDEAIADNPNARTTAAATLLLDQPASFVFDKNAPDFGMLRAGGPPKKQTHRGHVTVLKIAFPGGGGGGGTGLDDIELDADGLVLTAVEASDSFKAQADGTIEHSFGLTASLAGSYGGNPFFADGAMTGTMVERGALTNAIIPEPTSLALMGFATLLVTRRRR
jgi:hypothetical protein